MRAEAGEHLEIELVAPVPALDGATGQRQARVGHHTARVEEGHRTQAIAFRAGADRVVEGEQARFQFGDRVAADGAGELGREQVFLVAVEFHGQRAPVGVPQRRLEGLGQALLGVGAHLEAVYHDIHAVFAVLGQFGQRVDLVHAAIDPHAHEPLRAQLFHEVVLFALAAGHHRREDHQPRVLGQRHDVIDHLRHRLRLERQLVFGAAGRADPRIQEAQVVVDLGDGAHGGARVVAGGFLLDGNGRRQALDEVHVGLLHQLQELARVGGQRFDVTALAFGIQRVEGQRTLSRARQAGDHHQFLPRQVEADVLQVMRACAADSDQFHVAQFDVPGSRRPGRTC